MVGYVRERQMFRHNPGHFAWIFGIQVLEYCRLPTPSPAYDKAMWVFQGRYISEIAIVPERFFEEVITFRHWETECEVFAKGFCHYRARFPLLRIWRLPPSAKLTGADVEVNMQDPSSWR